MKQTGSLLKETIEIEALCAKKCDEARQEAERIIRAAENDADTISAESAEQIDRYKKHAILSVEKKKESIQKDFEIKSRTGIDQLKKNFDAIADRLAQKTAERVIRYD